LRNLSRDDAHAIMARLRAAVGEGNFGFTASPGPRPGARAARQELDGRL
jgi:hypothetical protein